jgi:Mg2+/citrate symporter
MNLASQLIRNVQNRFGHCTSDGSLEELNEAQLKARKQKIKSVYFVLGFSALLALIANSFTMYDTLELYIPFTVMMGCLFIVFYKEYRKKLDRINEHLNETD